MTAFKLFASLALIATPAAASAQDRTAPPAAKQSKEMKYCLTYETRIGSRITKTECKTKQEWSRDGIDVDEILKK